MKHTVLLLCCTSLVAGLLLAGCRACSHPQALAVLLSKHGEVRRDRAKSGSGWQLAEVGVAFELGDAVRTAPAAIATLELEGGSKLQVQPGTTIRFQNRRPSSKRREFSVETGQVLVEAGRDDVILDTGNGIVRVRANSQLLVRRTDTGLRFEVTVGRALIEEADQSHPIEVGESYSILAGDTTPPPTLSADAGLAASLAQPKADAGMSPTADGALGIAAVITGNGVSQKGPGERTFQPIAQGNTQVQPGTTVHIDSGSRMNLQRGRTQVTLMGAGNYVVRADPDALLDLKSGKLTLEGPTRIAVPGGVIETNDNARASVETAGANRVRVQVARGMATLVNGQPPTRVSAGQAATLSGDGSAQLEGSSLAYADMTAHVGESFVVHDPGPPTAIRFLFDARCTTGGVVRVQSKGRAICRWRGCHCACTGHWSPRLRSVLPWDTRP